MIAPAMMSGQPDPIIAINTAATMVKTFTIASFRVDSQIARIDATKANQSIRTVSIHRQSKRCHASHQRWRRRAAF